MKTFIKDQRPKNRENSLLSKLMNYISAVNAAALNYGKQNESRARKLPKKQISENINCFVTGTTGLHLGSDVPFIGASPDALTECKCHGKLCWKLNVLTKTEPQSVTKYLRLTLVFI